MHILIGLVVASVLVIGWGFGNLFVCVFLTLPIVGIALMFATTSEIDHSGHAVFLVFALLAIWAPFWMRRKGNYRGGGR